MFCRKKRMPYLLEATVSRLHGHSSASGAERVSSEPDCIELFGQRLLSTGLITQGSIADVYAAAEAEVEVAVAKALQEPRPTPADVARHTFAPSRVDIVYPEDFTGLPI